VRVLYCVYILYIYAQGINTLDAGTAIDLEQFRSGCTLWKFDRTPDQCLDAAHEHESIKGQLSLDLEFDTALTHNLSLIVLGFWKSVFYITPEVCEGVWLRLNLSSSLPRSRSII
jgi:hypothetical protein